MQATMSENEIARMVVDAAVHVNFGAALMKDGITRVVNGLHEEG